MVSANIRVTSPLGLHLRPAMKLCAEAQKYRAECTFQVRDTRGNMKSMLQLLAVGARCGDMVGILCEGPDEEEALDALQRVFMEELQ